MTQDETKTLTLQYLESLADSIVRRGLSVPAVFFLELHKPLATCISMAASAAEPMIALLLGKEFAKQAPTIFESRDTIERLIVLIEERA
jgi:hypothetical protein